MCGLFYKVSVMRVNVTFIRWWTGKSGQSTVSSRKAAIWWECCWLKFMPTCWLGMWGGGRMWEASEVSAISGVDVIKVVFLSFFLCHPPTQPTACAQASIRPHKSEWDPKTHATPAWAVKPRTDPPCRRAKHLATKPPYATVNSQQGQRRQQLRQAWRTVRSPQQPPGPKQILHYPEETLVELQKTNSTHTSTQHKNPKQSRKTTQPWLPFGLSVC